MVPNEINALSTSIIAFVTVLGLVVGFYYNLKSSGTEMLQILFLELLLLCAILIFSSRIKEWMKK